jgi:hypothetical protein
MVGIETVENDGVYIYPNPTGGQLIIDNGELTIENVEILDLMGKSVYSSTRPLVHSSTIDISDLPTGTYFIHIQTENEVITRKIVKQ